MAASNRTTLRSDRGFKLIALKEESVERKVALAFGFMSFIPVLLIVCAYITKTDIMLALFGIAASMFIGYFVIIKRMVRSIVTMSKQVKELKSGQVPATLEVAEGNEIGELAKAFNRITHDLEQKISELESSREQVKRLLSRIGAAIMTYEGIDNLLNLIMENTVNALDAQRGSLMLVDAKKEELSVKTTWPVNGKGTGNGEVHVKLGEGLLGWVAKEGRPMRDAGNLAKLGFGTNEAGDGAILCVPLKLHEQPMGVVMLMREDASKTFTDDDLSLVENISSQISVAIENYRLNLSVERTYIETIRALALAVEAKDPYSAGHSKRVGYYATQVADAMGLDVELCRMINDAGVLHDIGKIGIKDEILLKPDHLTHEEMQIMQQHPVIGEAIVKPIQSLSKVAPFVLYHHEFYNGLGYPNGLKGDQIPLGARILAVVDTFDSMVTDRPYRKRLTHDVAKAELKKEAGEQFDPAVVTAFIKILDQKEERSNAMKASQP